MKISNYFIFDVLRIAFANAFANKNMTINENKSFRVDDFLNILIPSSKLKRLKFKITQFISVNLMHNESINEEIQTIINKLFTDVLDISKIHSFYHRRLITIIDDHKIWIRMLNIIFQHSVQETITYQKYEWILSISIFFHLQFNMMKMLLINNYDFIKIKTSNRSNLKQHEKFWARKKVRSKKWNFHAVKKFIMQNYKIRIVVVFWIFVEKERKFEFEKNEDFSELKYLNDWISRVFNSKLFEMIKKIRKYILIDDMTICQNEKLRNHIFFCQQIEAYLLLKFFISKDDIDFFSHAFVKTIMLFHETRKHNYHMLTLYMFWMININACSSKLKKIILINSLINVRDKKNKFIVVDLHLKFFNDYMKKIMRNKRIFFIDVKYLFKYNIWFANTIRNQLLWMKRFHEMRMNIWHSIVNQKIDIVKLAQKLRNEMKIHRNCRILETNRIKNLFVNDAKNLNQFVRKFNRR